MVEDSATVDEEVSNSPPSMLLENLETPNDAALKPLRLVPQAARELYTWVVSHQLFSADKVCPPDDKSVVASAFTPAPDVPRDQGRCVKGL
jgi:hypothetical protein